jgi:phosphoribosylamine-glycine ligase
VKFLFRSSDGLCLPQALRVQAEGHKVKLSVDNGDFQDAGNGLIEKVLNFENTVQWADVVIYDVQDGPLPKEADRVRLIKPTLGSSELGGKLEHDREFGIKVAKEAGIKVPDVEKFTGPRAFLKANEYIGTKPRDVDWVWKSNGKSAEGAKTYVAKNEGRPEMERMLRHYETLYKKQNVNPDFILTTKVEGVEISTEAWFNGKIFSLPNHTIERTKFFPSDLGEKTGCCGNVVWSVDMQSPLVVKLLLSLAPVLVDKFVGPLDVNVIIEKESNEPVFLEFSPRFGYDAIFALMELFPMGSFGEFLYTIASQLPWTKPISEQFAGDVRVHIPPYPAKGSREGADEAVGVPIFGVKPLQYNPHIHLVEIMLNEKDEPVTSGPHGFVLSCTALGQSPQLAEKAAYKLIEHIQIPNMRYRNDLDKIIQETYDNVEATGWLNVGTKSPMGLESTQWKRPTKMSWNHQARRF